MSDSADRATPGEQPKPDETGSNDDVTQDPTSPSDWAAFGSLIRKLDAEYAETLAGPTHSPREKPKPTDQ